MNVLIVIDMQNDFITGPLGTPEAVKIVPLVANKIKAWQDQCILLTKDTHECGQKYLATQEGRRLPVPHCTYGCSGWYEPDAIHDACVQFEESSISHYCLTIEKSQFGSWKFLPQKLHYFERTGRKVESITLVGVCTDICVISNAMILKAALPETTIIVDAACCAGTTPEAHENALKAMRQCQIDIINWE